MFHSLRVNGARNCLFQSLALEYDKGQHTVLSKIIVLYIFFKDLMQHKISGHYLRSKMVGVAFSRLKFILRFMKTHQWVQILFKDVETHKHHDNIK
jgi:hypothetical protein